VSQPAARYGRPGTFAPKPNASCARKHQQHAARQQAEHCYASVATLALGDQAGADLQADPASPQIVRRLHEAESSGWDPARLLAAVATQRDLATADSLAEVLAWRLDGYLADNQAPPRNGQPYESVATAWERLAEVARTTLGPQQADLAQAEVAWPALITALRRAEAADFDAAELLSHLASPRALRATGSISEDLAIRINHYLATHPDPENTTSRPELPLPWMTPPPAVTSPAVAQYLHDATDLIASRAAELADIAVRHGSPWMQPLGQPPTDPERKRQWQAHVAIVATYREQFKVTTDDPGHILGPHAEPGTQLASPTGTPPNPSSPPAACPDSTPPPGQPPPTPKPGPRPPATSTAPCQRSNAPRSAPRWRDPDPAGKSHVGGRRSANTCLRCHSRYPTPGRCAVCGNPSTGSIGGVP
jgi:hypothetical protein